METRGCLRSAFFEHPVNTTRGRGKNAIRAVYGRFAFDFGTVRLNGVRRETRLRKISGQKRFGGIRRGKANHIIPMVKRVRKKTDGARILYPREIPTNRDPRGRPVVRRKLPTPACFETNQSRAFIVLRGRDGAGFDSAYYYYCSLHEYFIIFYTVTDAHIRVYDHK